MNVFGFQQQKKSNYIQDWEIEFNEINHYFIIKEKWREKYDKKIKFYSADIISIHY